jgi:O-antigen/teichoic acid export membrane protein
VSVSTRRALVYVYAGYTFRYLYLLVLVPFYARVLGSSEYGRLLAAMSLFQVVWMIVEYGFPLVGARDTAATREPEGLARIYRHHMAGRSVMMVAGVAIGVAGTYLSPLLRTHPWFGVFATLNGIVAGFNLGWYFQGTLRFRTSVWIEVLGFAINIALILPLVRGPDDAWRVLASLLFSSVICTLLSHRLASRDMHSGDRISAGLDPIRLIREATPLFAFRGMSTLMSSSPTYMMSLFAPAQQVGWYGAAERLIGVGLGLLQPANQVMVGTVSSRVRAPDGAADAYAIMRRGLWVMAALGVAMTLGALVLATPFVTLVLGRDFEPTIPLFRVLSLILPLSALAQVATSYILIPLRLDAWATWTSVLGAVATLLFIALLGPRFFGDGVAWARVLGQLFMTVALLFALIRTGVLRRVISRW